MTNQDKVNHLNELGEDLLCQLQVNHVAQCKLDTPNSEYFELCCEEGDILGKLEDADALIDHYNQLINLGLTW